MKRFGILAIGLAAALALPMGRIWAQAPARGGATPAAQGAGGEQTAGQGQERRLALTAVVVHRLSDPGVGGASCRRRTPRRRIATPQTQRAA